MTKLQRINFPTKKILSQKSAKNINNKEFVFQYKNIHMIFKL